MRCSDFAGNNVSLWDRVYAGRLSWGVAVWQTYLELKHILDSIEFFLISMSDVSQHVLFRIFEVTESSPRQ